MCTAVNIFEEKMKEIGEQIGFESGKVEGIHLGRNQVYEEMIRAMYENGMNIEEIMKISHLSEDEIMLYIHH